MKNIVSLSFTVILCLVVLCNTVWAGEYVIGAGNDELINRVLGLEMEKAGKHKIDSFSVENNKIKVCYMTKGDKWCVYLLHYSEKIKDGLRAGNFYVLADNENNHPVSAKYLETLINVIKKSNLGDIWTEAAPSVGTPEWKETSAQNGLIELVSQLLDEAMIEKAEKVVSIIENLGFGVDTNNLRARIEIQKGNFAEAATTIAKIKDESKQTLERARLFLFEQKVDEGVAEFGKYLKTQGDKPELTSCNIDDIAKYLFKQGKKQEALEIRRKAAPAFKDCSILWERLSESLLDLGLEDEALGIIEPMAKKMPDEIPVQTAYANILRRQKKRVEASEVFLQMYEKTKKYGFLRMYSTVVSQTPDNLPLLLKEREYLKKDPESIIHRHAAGVLSYYNGFYEDSRKYMDEMRKELPEDTRTYIYGAMSRYELGDWDGAKAWLDELKRIGTDDPDIFYCYAVLYSQRDPLKSAKFLDDYLKVPLHPDSYPPKHAKAIGYQQRLLKGELIPDWAPSVEKKKTRGCNSIDVYEFSFSSILLLLACLMLRKRKCIQ